MAKTTPHEPVKLFVGMLGASEGLFSEAVGLLGEQFGIVDVTSPLMDFDFTDYYAGQMGLSLKRVFYAFRELIDPAQIARIKLLTNSIEEKFAARGLAFPRPLNLDPGYLTAAKLTLATAKNFAHRIYLAEGIYAEVTLNWRDGAWRGNPWTYPDYLSEGYLRFFTDLRVRYLEQLRHSD